MATFATLSDRDKVQRIKDKFEQLVEDLAADPARIRVHFELDKKPVLAIATPKAIPSSASETERAEIEKLNSEISAKINEQNAVLETEYAERVAQSELVAKAISKLEKAEYCLCGTCFNIDLTGGAVPPDFEPLIEKARELAIAS